MLNQEEITPTRLLYYDDAYTREFDAEIIKILKTEAGEIGLVLDKTAFYPGGGGQLSDVGSIESSCMEARVVRLQRLGETIVHFIGRSIEEVNERENIKGVIDWDRRYRLMRIHTSAHVMSQAVRQALDKPVEIVSSGMSLDKARLDFKHEGSTREFFPEIESVVNNVVKENRLVKAKLMFRSEAEEYVRRFHESFKTLPPQITEVRIVEIEGWHACACGGTHVKSTGEIREIKLLSRSSKGKGIERIEFTVQKP
jgi:misacylated tRNA(Ala) deacylase